jgi:predicted nucleotidyltransferase
MTQVLARRRNVAQRVAKALESRKEVTALLVFGSVASGFVDARSDVDILAVCYPEILPLAERMLLLSKIGVGWIFGSSVENRLFSAEDKDGLVDSIPVSLHYHSVHWMDVVVHEVVEHGAITTTRLPFRPYTLVGLLQRAWILFDKEDCIANWRQRASPYPLQLKQNIVRHFIPVLQEEIADLVLTAERLLGAKGFLFHLGRAVDAMCSILYAINGVYDPADRRAEQNILPYLTNVPERFMFRLNQILEGPFTQTEVNGIAQRFMELAEEVIARAEIEIK